MKGHCILCNGIIWRDINNVFCIQCESISSRDPQQDYIFGDFCHYCGLSNGCVSNSEPRCIDCKPLNRNNNSIDDYYLKIVDDFKNRSLEIRQEITPCWKILERNSTLGYNFQVVLKDMGVAEILKIIESTRHLNTSSIFENEPKSNRRIMNILRAWQHGIELRPPIISYVDNGLISVYDGNHRALAAHYLGVEVIPVYSNCQKG